MAAYALVRFEFRVRLGAGLIFFVVALGGYLLGRSVARLQPRARR